MHLLKIHTIIINSNVINQTNFDGAEPLISTINKQSIILTGSFTLV